MMSEELKVKINSMRKSLPSDEVIDAMKEDAYESGNISDAFEKGLDLGEAFGFNQALDKILALAE